MSDPASRFVMNPRASVFRPRQRVPLLVVDLLVDYLQDSRRAFADEITELPSDSLTTDIGESRRTLANLSLVQRSWSVPAREALQRRIVLCSEDSMHHVFNARRMHSIIKELWIMSGPGTSHRARLVRLYKSIYAEDTWASHFERDSVLGFDTSFVNYNQLPYGRQNLMHCLLMRLPNLRHLCIEIGGYGGHENPDGLEPMLHAISLMSQLESLVLTTNSVCTDPDKPRFSYPYFIPLCTVVSKLQVLKLLYISHWTCLSTQITDRLTDELHSCTPPQSLKTIVIEVIDEPLPVHYTEWLLRPRGDYAVENLMIRGAEICRDQFVSVIGAGSNLSSILRLNISSKLAVASTMQDLVSASTSITQLHLNFTTPNRDFLLPTSLEEIHFRFFGDCHCKDRALAAFLSAHVQRQPHSRLQCIIVEPEHDNQQEWNSGGLKRWFPKAASLCLANKIRFIAGKAWGGKEGMVVASFLSGRG